MEVVATRHHYDASHVRSLLAGVIFGIYLVVGTAAVKSHEAKPSAISPLYRERVEYIPEFHDYPCYNILIPWLHNGSAITFFTLVGDI